MTTAAAEHRRVAGVFSDRVRGVRPPEASDTPAPCEVQTRLLAFIGGHP